jgi:hypothetical protein
MWRIYSDPKKKDGIKVKTTVRKLFANLEESGSVAPYLQFFIGKVAYKTEEEIYDLMRGLTFLDIAYGGQGCKFAELLCIKREAFSHEAEVRILFQDIEPLRGVDRIYVYPLDANNIFDEVVVDPRLSEADSQSLQTEIRAKGYVGTIKQSSLYRSPSFTIPLQSIAVPAWK